MPKLQMPFPPNTSSRVTRLVACAAFLTFLLAAATPLHAQEPPKVAVVDLEALFFSVSEGQGLQKSLADLEKSTKAEVETIAQRIQQIRQDAANKPLEEQRAAARRIEDEERNAQRTADRAKRQAAKLEQEARDSYNERLEPILRQIQEEEGLDLILNKAPGVVIFASAAVDMSQALLAKLNGG